MTLYGVRPVARMCKPSGRGMGSIARGYGEYRMQLRYACEIQPIYRSCPGAEAIMLSTSVVHQAIYQECGEGHRAKRGRSMIPGT